MITLIRQHSETLRCSATAFRCAQWRHKDPLSEHNSFWCNTNVCSVLWIWRELQCCIYNAISFAEYIPLLYHLYEHGLLDIRKTTQSCQTPTRQCSKHNLQCSAVLWLNSSKCTNNKANTHKVHLSCKHNTVQTVTMTWNNNNILSITATSGYCLAGLLLQSQQVTRTSSS